MTVKELIEELKHFPQDKEIWVLDDYNFYIPEIFYCKDDSSNKGILTIGDIYRYPNVSDEDNF
jgi:hypothetical protein